ncbi:alpha/beta hydrolase [Microbacterium sp. CPCC 204701]|uniref:alpha/beta hydrolase n=1 Tax=Microbacterium sp. CPCC 204701 TaxID=2493084 RepID=UPI000FD96C2A|nr:alpha/beta hydrolase [Microbacterium sp. CPCC 204701]
MAEPVRDLLAVPQDFTSGRIDIASGVARMSATLWATRWQDPDADVDTAVVFVHPTSNFMGHYALRSIAARGLAAIGMATRYAGNDSALITENCLLDIGAVVRYLREDLGYAKVLLVGNSGGGSLAALYQSQAENPTITATPAGDPPDLTVDRLPPLDGLSLAMAHPGRARVYTDSLDAAIRDEHNPFDRDPELDMFRAEHGPPYSPDFVERYRAAQEARNRRITAWVRDELARLAEDPSGPDDLPFVVHGTAADPRFLDVMIDPSDRVPNTILGDPWKTNFLPARLGHYSSLRSWLSQWSIDDSRSDAIAELPHVTVPVQIVYGTADNAVFPSHAKAMFEAIRSERKEMIVLEGADHYFRTTPHLRQAMCDHIARWAHSL